MLLLMYTSSETHARLPIDYYSPSSSHGKRLMLIYLYCGSCPLLKSQYFIGLPGVNHRPRMVNVANFFCLHLSVISNPVPIEQ